MAACDHPGGSREQVNNSRGQANSPTPSAPAAAQSTGCAACMLHPVNSFQPAGSPSSGLATSRSTPASSCSRSCSRFSGSPRGRPLAPPASEPEAAAAAPPPPMELRQEQGCVTGCMLAGQLCSTNCKCTQQRGITTATHQAHEVQHTNLLPKPSKASPTQSSPASTRQAGGARLLGRRTQRQQLLHPPLHRRFALGIAQKAGRECAAWWHTQQHTPEGGQPV